MLNSMLRSLFGTSSERQLKKVAPLLDEVRAHEARMLALTNDRLRAKTGEFKERLARGASLDEILPEAFAAVCEAAKRVVGMRPFDVQVLGGIVLHNGCIAEMVTGEGKTLVATMPVYLNALSGNGVHVVTVNDFLARRDSEWMGPIYQFMGLTTGLIQHDMGTAERQVGYRADLTYGTNNEFGFDYLRDNMAIRPEMRVQRKLNYAIVDEIDSILIDEARTPLIISGRPEKSTDIYYKVDDVVRRLRKDAHYEIEEKGHHVLITEDGMNTLEALLGVDDLFTEHLGLVHMVEQALRAHNFYKRDDEYVVYNGEVLIVDEFTGRMMEGRRYSDGLHQALEAKERVAVQFESQTVATITYQNYFKLYNKLAGMTGTAATEASEFAQIYELEVVQIPTNLPLIREDLADLVFATEEGKFRHVVRRSRKSIRPAAPCLSEPSPSRSPRKSPRCSRNWGSRTSRSSMPNTTNEKPPSSEMRASAAPLPSPPTWPAAAPTSLGDGVRELGGLAIVGTERHESRRIDNQLRGRCGRQGDPGNTRFFLSLEDEVARLFGGDKVKRLLDWFGSQQMDDEPLSQKMVSRSIERAQRQVEEYNFEIRKHLKEYDDVMNKQRMIIYDMRRNVLEDRDVTEQLHEMFESIVGRLVNEFAPDDVLPDEWDLEGLSTGFRAIFGFEFSLEPPASDSGEPEPRPLFEELVDQVVKEYERREHVLEDEIRAHFRSEIGGDEAQVDFARIARKRTHDLEMMALLRAVDEKWIDHLYSMDYLRDSVRLRAYGQKDPLVEYKTEAFEMFQSMMASIEEEVAQTLFRLSDPEVRRRRRTQAERGVLTPAEDPFAKLSQYSYVQADKQQDRSFASFDTSRFALAGQPDGEQQQPGERLRPRVKQQPIRRSGPEVKPNDPCPCGSGKKYKKCCGAIARN